MEAHSTICNGAGLEFKEVFISHARTYGSTVRKTVSKVVLFYNSLDWLRKDPWKGRNDTFFNLRGVYLRLSILARSIYKV